jgi:eukaryotic-like serine/threonine-protein kinase
VLADLVAQSHSRCESRWRGDGKEIYFMAPDSKLMAASVDTASGFESGTPAVLFQADPHERFATTEMIIYAVRHDGQRFLVNTSYNNGSEHPMSVVLNWKSETR